MYEVYIAEHREQAQENIKDLHEDGFTKNDIYIFAYDKKYSDTLTHLTHTNDVSIDKNHNFLQLIINVLRSRSDELCEEMKQLGLTHQEASMYATELDLGRLVIIGVKE